MFKRFIAIISTVLLCFTIGGCGNSNKTSELQENKKTLTDYNVFETTDSKEYTDFLKELDSSTNRKIVGISNDSYAFSHMGPRTIYTITYKICDNAHDIVDTEYEYFLFECHSEKEYLSFLDNLADEYEIFNVSIGSYALAHIGPSHIYIVTYRKIL